MTAKKRETQPQRSAVLLMASLSLSALIATSAAAGYEIGKSKPPEIVSVTKEIPTVITEKIPERYEVKVYYPVASPIAKPPHGHCQSVADALNMFEFLQIDRRVDTLTEDK
jgi:hypothetical protein